MRWKFSKIKICTLIILLVASLFIYVWLNRKAKIYGSFSQSIDFDELVDSADLRHKIWYNVWKPSFEELNTYDVTVVTQTSLNNFHLLEELSKTWDGYISVAVFTTGVDVQAILEYTTYLVSCSPNLANRVFIHVVIPVSHPPFERLLQVKSDVSCLNSHVRNNLKQGGSRNYALDKVSYPVNLLRNVALKQVPTDYVLVLDIDMLPSMHLRKNVLQMPILKQPFVALVVPAFEVNSRNYIPSNKKELVVNWKDGKIRPFYEKVCWKCQMYTEYEKWKRDVDSVFYEVTWHDPWEPFYIAHKQVIIYDERFEQYGFNRISQLCRLHISGHRFYVLSQSYILHLGFKEKQNFHNNKDEENKRNRIIYRKVKDELTKKYLSTGRKC